MASDSTRDLIVRAADELFYQRGFEKTSFADIAEVVGISRGNFYHHFKAKDDILSEVITLRACKTKEMLDMWTRNAKTPADRLRCFAQMLIENRKNIQRYGCPVGTLCSELAKLDHPSQGGAGMIFGQFRSWLREQFEALGRGVDADSLSMHLLARSQGIAALATAFHDETFIRREVELIDTWLDDLKQAPIKSRSRRAS
ncbi:TetR/AcrR family transcriptional regulator [Variovorax paradoxus]|nr:TetR/AcrR family transcriptional regulator [Variovorax paradoxus]